MDNLDLTQPDDIERKIIIIRDRQVMIDRDLADIYGVKTKRLMEQVKRNIERFPDDFCFQLDDDEFTIWRSQNATSKSDQKGLRRPPYAFTEQGVAMLASVLKTKTAVEESVKIIRAFVAMRHFIINNAKVLTEIESIKHQLFETNVHVLDNEKKINEVFLLMEKSNTEVTQGIFFNGQIFDSFVFVIDLIKKAKTEIILIDNYVDETVLTMLDNRNPNVLATIFTAHFGEKMDLALAKHNSQYQPITIEHFNKSHDRFLIIDDDVYLIGGSIKDLGKKVSTFVKLSIPKEEFFSKLFQN